MPISWSFVHFASEGQARRSGLYAAPNLAGKQRVNASAKTDQMHKSREKHKVLLVEDDPTLARMTGDTIKTFGFEVETAQSSDEALDMLKAEKKFDLVITDIILSSKLNGFRLAQVIRERLPDVPLIYMSGYTGYTHVDMGDTVAPMLRKPCNPDELSNAIYTAIGTIRH